jgi:DNA-binding IclR family transcriptional regulator
MAQKQTAVCPSEGRREPGAAVVSRYDGPRHNAPAHTTTPSVKSAARALRIVEYFDARRCPLAEIEIERALGFPQSSTSALLHTLAEMGYLQHDPQARLYAPSNRIAMLGHWINHDLVREGPLLQLAGDLVRYTDRTCIISSRAGAHVQAIHVRRPRRASSPIVEVGSKTAICLAAPGAVLLRNATDTELNKLILRSGAHPFANPSRAWPDWFLSVLNGQRVDGYAFGESARHVGQAEVAAPFGQAGRQDFALSIMGPTEDMLAHRDRYGRLMLDLIDRTAKLPLEAAGGCRSPDRAGASAGGRDTAFLRYLRAALNSPKPTSPPPALRPALLPTAMDLR